MRRSHLVFAVFVFAVMLVILNGPNVRIVRAQNAPIGSRVAGRLAADTSASQPIPKTWTPPDPARIPHGEPGESILFGMHIFQETPRYAPDYAGNKISCGNCHIQTGTVPYAMPLVGAPSWFPQSSERAGRMITLEDRIQECMTRSENGKPLPHDSREMQGLLSFFDWLAVAQQSTQPNPPRGLVSLPDLQGDVTRGEAIYTKQCSGCHGTDGAGVPPILPPLWGSGAYNDGAGMNQVKKMAAFVAKNMPQNKPGTLTPQEAYDVSAFVASKPHSAYNHAYDIY